MLIYKGITFIKINVEAFNVRYDIVQTKFVH